MPKSNTEQLIFMLAMALALTALILIACSPASFTASKVVYQGF